ncbi:MAG TPA: LamG-like jellyroll fold domain-containing protein [Flavisolibacter sp.]|nr:LamG-like jellyroll fold domain-containing protein [Flavisolibacter sp.]
MAPYPERRVTSVTPMPEKVWTHIAVTVDYANPSLPQAYLYVNGVKTGPSPQGMPDLGGTNTPYTVTGLGATTNNWLGRSQYFDAPEKDPYFNGVIDELRISNTLQYTSNFTPATTLSETGATALYHFEDAPGSQTAANSIAPGPGPIILGSTTTVEPTEDPTFTVLTTLPVFILQFDAQKTGKVVVLNWKVFSTGEGGQFVIERSTNGINFQPIGTKSIPATQGTFSYGFEDYSYNSGKNYYRLKVMENYAPVKYSSVVSVEGEALFTAYPTITSSQIFIRIPQVTTIAIYNSNGLLMKKVQLTSSQNIDVSRFSKGSYQIFFEGSNETVRFVKL